MSAWTISDVVCAWVCAEGTGRRAGDSTQPNRTKAAVSGLQDGQAFLEIISIQITAAWQMCSPLVCVQHLEMQSDGKGCHGRSENGRVTAQSPFYRFRDQDLSL